MNDRTLTPTRAASPGTANDRLKQDWNERLWGSMIAAVALHFVVLQGWPTMTAAEIITSGDALEHITLPEVNIPPAPEKITRPAAPVAAATDVSADVTIAPLDWEAPTAAPPPPSASTEGATASSAGFTPFTVAPTITNRAEASRMLDREYPQALKNAGIGGTVMVAFHIDARGRVLETRIESSSGYERFDRAATAVAAIMRFTPAINRETPVAVWVTFPVVFLVR